MCKAVAGFVLVLRVFSNNLTYGSVNLTDRKRVPRSGGRVRSHDLRRGETVYPAAVSADVCAVTKPTAVSRHNRLSPVRKHGIRLNLGADPNRCWAGSEGNSSRLK
ncbi:hypothetical protein SKAU_G00364740 [Synaphobranchus kaupii]|uniref:Secreted protein n=1 Tax=Synaphobranchus kaupii TaxID=118154 RepID=A0A9Q1EEU4_SYNKA|nr:hypothetical protein SKAU_G00364740 [Synaphobranchus kaupii]